MASETADIVVTGEECEMSIPGRPSCKAGILGDDGEVDPSSQAYGYHCDHWYEDEGCCYCDTTTINLVIIDDGSS